MIAELPKLEANIAKYDREHKLFTYYPDDGPLRRILYPRHMEFFAAGGRHQALPTCPDDCDGSPHRDRLALCANRVGKTEGMGGFEVALHLTGRYPSWWVGHRFSSQIDCWVSGKTNEASRNIVQTKLFGKVTGAGHGKTFAGTGLVPKEDIGEITWKRGIPNLADTVMVKHASGGWSECGIKSYEQKRGAFEGTEKDVIWLDEEPEHAIYEECGVRLMTRRGHLLLTFTPMEGMSDVVKAFLPGGSLPERFEERSQWLLEALR